MSDFVEFEHALIETARFVLRDGREFLFEARQTEPGKYAIQHIAGTPWMSSHDVDLLCAVEYRDGLGRIAGRLTRAVEPMQS